MKFLSIFLWLISETLFLSPVFGASSSTITKRENHFDAGLKISKVVDSNLKSYKVIKKDMNGVSSEGGQLTAYLKGKEIKKLVSVIYGEMGKSATSYYLHNGKLAYVKDVEYEYDRPMYEKGMKIAKKNITLFEIDNADEKSSSGQNENGIFESNSEKIQKFQNDVKEFSNLVFDQE